MDSFKATYVLENIDKKLGLCGWTKYQLFPKSEMIVPPQVLAMLLLPAVYRADKYLTLGEMLLRVNYGQNCERFRLF